MGFLICGRFEPTVHLARLLRYWASKILGSRSWPFGVTWRHPSRDHWIRNIGFPIGGLFEPTIYLARFLRYWASKILGSRQGPRSHGVQGVNWPPLFQVRGPSMVLDPAHLSGSHAIITANRSRPWPFGVTWRHLSRDHWIRNIGFPIGSQYEPTM